MLCTKNESGNILLSVYWPDVTNATTLRRYCIMQAKDKVVPGGDLLVG
jgi:hypothetical protein